MGEKVSTRAEVIRRVTEVHELLLKGARREQIVRLANDKYQWDVLPRQIDHYIAKARGRFEEEARVKREAELGKAIGRLDGLFLRSSTAGHNRDALAVQKELNELLGLKAPTRLEMSGPEGGPIITRDLSALSDEELERFEAILTKLEQATP